MNGSGARYLVPCRGGGPAVSTPRANHRPNVLGRRRSLQDSTVGEVRVNRLLQLSRAHGARAFLSSHPTGVTRARRHALTSTTWQFPVRGGRTGYSVSYARRTSTLVPRGTSPRVPSRSSSYWLGSLGAGIRSNPPVSPSLISTSRLF